MKKVFLSILFAGAVTFAHAQKSEVAEAKRLWGIFQLTLSQDPNAKEGEEHSAAKSAAFLQKQMDALKNGLTHTDKAIVHEKTKDLPESWLYKALFASSISYVDSLNLENSLKYQADAEKAIEETKRLDAKKQYEEDLQIASANIRNAMVTRGMKAFNNKDYATAFNYFVDVTKKNPNDTAMYMNAGIIGRMAEKYPEAIENYRKLVSFNVPDAKNFYLEMVSIATENLKDTVQALNILKEANEKFPEDPQIIGAETDIYINKGDIDKSQSLLKKLIEKDPSKSVYHFLMGETYYRQALLIQTERNKIDERKMKEPNKEKAKQYDKDYDAATAKMVALIDQSLPFYKKSLELDPKFEPTLEALKQIYGFKNDTENFNSVKKQLDDLQKQ